MKGLFAILLLISYSFNSYSQKEVKLNELKDHIVDSIKIQGKISEVRVYAGPKPADKFALLIMGEESGEHLYVRINPSKGNQSLNLAPFELEGKTILVYGKVDTLRHFYHIIVNDPNQIKIINK